MHRAIFFKLESTETHDWKARGRIQSSVSSLACSRSKQKKFTWMTAESERKFVFDIIVVAVQMGYADPGCRVNGTELYGHGVVGSML